MRDWLPGDWKEDAITRSAERSAETVARRVIRRNKTVRAARWTAVAVVVLAVVFVLAPRLDHHSPIDRGRQIAHRAPVQHPAEPESAPQTGQKSPSPAVLQNEAVRPVSKQAPVDVQVTMHDQRIVVTWRGAPSDEYVVYRCTSPKFDTCSMAGIVKGTMWTDREANQAPLVFYKVEPKAQG